jgi:hypothetical protein
MICRITSFDELYEQVKVYFQEDYNIKANDLQW